MRILVDKIELNLLLEKKKAYIGKSVTFDSILSAVSFLIAVVFATYKDFLGLSGSTWKIIGVFFGLFFTIKAIYDLVINKKNQYTHDDLLEDINNLNKIASRHSIVVIKDSFNKYSNRYLVYDDVRWDCKFFINYKTNEDNITFIRKHLSSDLKIDIDSISLDFVTEKINSKYSNSNNKVKTYEHRFYIAKIDDIPKSMQEDNFMIDGKRYHWMTLYDLQQDDDVIKKNSDVLDVVKGNF